MNDTPPKIPSKALFELGLCDAMAIAIHSMTGLQLGLWRAYQVDGDDPEEEAYVDVHAVCIIEQGTSPVWIDVNGINKGMMTDEMSSLNALRYELVSATEEEVGQAFSTMEYSRDNPDFKEQLKLAELYIEHNADLQQAIQQARPTPAHIRASPSPS